MRDVNFYDYRYFYERKKFFLVGGAKLVRMVYFVWGYDF